MGRASRGLQGCSRGLAGEEGKSPKGCSSVLAGEAWKGHQGLVEGAPKGLKGKKGRARRRF